MKAKVIYSDEVCMLKDSNRIREIELSTIDELIQFMIEQRENVIVAHKAISEMSDYSDRWEYPGYDLVIEVYNDYRE